MKKAISLICLLLITTTMAFGQNVAELMTSGIKLQKAHNEALALVKFKKVLSLDKNNYEALHRASLLYSRVGHRLPDKERKSKYFRLAKSLAQRAIDQNSTDAEGYFVMSVALGRIALIAGSKERVAASTDIKKNAETALRYNKNHAGAWHILGRWNIKVANLNFAERAAANVLFGGLPEGASNANAIKCYKNALTYKPNYILYLYDLAGAYSYAKLNDKSKETLDKLLKLKPVTPDDRAILEEAKMIRSDM